MKILVTGAKGFLGKNLVENLKNVKMGKSRVYPQTEMEIYEYDVNNCESDLERFCLEADFVFHLAGVNRPKDSKEFYEGNSDLTTKVLSLLEKGKCPPIMISSSIQAERDNDYGKSKVLAENAVMEYSKKTGAKNYIYRFYNLFGKWSRPSYNSVVATFCHNVANGLDISVSDENAKLTLSYVDDVVYELIDALFGNEHRAGQFCFVPKTHTITLGRLAEIIKSFKENEGKLNLPNCSDELTKKLYAMYLGYVPCDKLKGEPETKGDDRGSFTELYKCYHGEQVSLNVVKPGKIKGNHWHNTKIERFTSIEGKGVIRLRKIGEQKVYEYYFDDEIISVDIPAGYTHNFENLGEKDVKILIWCNEAFNPSNPDTFFEEV